MLRRSSFGAAAIVLAAGVVACSKPTGPQDGEGAAVVSQQSATRLTAAADDPCQYTLGPQASPYSDGGTLAVDVTSLCSWNASSDQPWLTTNAAKNGWAATVK